VNSSTFMEC